ncbi:MAG: replicative DNA helicase [Deltaproteobacteria bacterium]|nr:MAG: replicative DNA helicase [Deltaproteobacteria bacterium]
MNAQGGEPTRVPPHNIEAEQSVLGGLLLDNEVLSSVLEILNGNEFYRAGHRTIFAAVIDLFERNEPCDLITLANLLKSQKKLEEVGGASYLASLLDRVPSAANVDHYARIVKEKSLVRALINRATGIVASGFDSGLVVDDLLDQAEQAIFQVSEERINPSFFPIKEVIKQSVKTLEQLYDRREMVTGVPTGFVELDRLTSGLQPSDLIIIAGRPSMGKTALALNIARNAAVDGEVPVGVFSLEMAKEQLSMRMLCAEARVDSQRLRSGFLSEQDWPRLTRAAGTISEAPIFIDDSPVISALELRAKARRLKRDQHLGLIIVDYLQLMRGSHRIDSREQEISEISRSLKALAKELKVPVVSLSQLNRRVEERHNKRPQLADLRESGAIEQDADVIAFIYRDEVYHPESPDQGLAEIIVGKQRNGPTGTAKLTFLTQFTRFENRAFEETG